MKYFIHSITLLLGLMSGLIAFNSHPESLRAKPIEYKTVMIVNNKYLASSEWKALGRQFDKKGEDVNSKQFGGIYHPPFMKRKRSHDPRLSIARQLMEIEIDMINKTDDTWHLESVELEVIKPFDLAGYDIDKEEWDLGPRVIEYRPYLEISPDKKSVVELVNDVQLRPRKRYSDSHMIIEVAVSQDPTQRTKIYQFKLKLNFLKAGSNEKVQVLSDKTYHIASE